MARKPSRGKCVYCLSSFDKLQWDHVFPRLWYSTTTPQDLEKWKVPCCNDCNQRYSKLEQDLLIRLGLGVGRKDPGAQGIAEKAVNSMRRQGQTKKLLEEITRLKAEPIPPQSLLANFGPYGNDQQYPISIPNGELEAFVRKLIRGINYLIDRSYIENDSDIDLCFPRDLDARNVTNRLSKKVGRTYCLGPSLKVTCASTKDSAESVYSIEIWGKLKVFAFVERQKIGISH